MHEELCSARLIIQLLQTEGNLVNFTVIASVQGRNHEARNDVSNDWKSVSANKVRTNRSIPAQQPQPIPTIINLFEIPDNSHIHQQTQQQRGHANSLHTTKKECDRIANSVRAARQTKGRDNYNRKTPTMKRNKVLIIGDSHARGCAQEIRHNLGHDFNVQGNVKPGATLQAIVTTSTDSMKKLTKEDVVVVWGGTRDVGKNESEKGLRHIRNFVENMKHTNVIVKSVPYRHDLAPNSCVNLEVEVYNRKLKKHLKVFDNTCVLKVDTDRDLFTRHGLHMNLKGKEHVAYKIINTIKVMVNRKKSVPIKMKYNVRANNESEGDILRANN